MTLPVDAVVVRRTAASRRAIGWDEAADRLDRGDLLRMEIHDGRRQWWFEAPYAVVPADVANGLTTGLGRKARVLDSDSLFGTPYTGQTWAAIRGTA